MHIRVGALFCQGRNEEVIRVGASTLSMVPLVASDTVRIDPSLEPERADHAV